MAPEILARFYSFVDKTTHPGGCWLWTGCVNKPGRPTSTRTGRNLYPRPRFLVSGGRFTEDGHRLGQQHVYAHRLMLALASGLTLEQVAGLEAHHTCENPEHRCINPYHQEWQTPEEHRAVHAMERVGSFI